MLLIQRESLKSEENDKGKPAGRRGRKAMGPGQGSPAAETRHERFAFLFLLLAALGSGGFLPSYAWAASTDFSHNVSVVVVPPELSFRNDGEDPSLSFSRGSAGSESRPSETLYQISTNTLPTQSYDGVVSARIAEQPEGILLEADTGPFSNIGTQLNTILYENTSGYKTVGKELIPLAGKGSTSGTQAGVLNGILPISWKTTATKNLSPEEHLLIVTITLKDA